MRKQKGEGGRSKNRPSSSRLAASLLPAGVSSVGFGGYLGRSRIESSSTAEESTPFSDVDSEVAQHLKRLGRKDPTTKLKALTALSMLFKQKSAEEIVQIVPQWAFEYKRLLHDYNREVRRATHDTMANLVIAIRRGLAPHLKSLMGPWWFSQFDPNPEVSQAARRSLEAAFPAAERRLDALMLCVNEIFLYLDENLKLTPQSMSDKATPIDELEDMHHRVISSSLLAVATLVDILLGVKLESHDDENVNPEQKLVSKARRATTSSAENMFSVHEYFLEFLKSKNPAIRSASYSVLTSFIKHIPHAFNEGNMKILSSAILGAFQEKDASCHSSMWDMILLFSRKFPGGWSHCNVQKVVLNRVWHFLRNGCYGSQTISYPAIILFLKSIPPEAVVWEQFIFDFFHNLWAGRNPLHSAADTLALFNAVRECFLWGLYNAPRYSASGDQLNHLPVKLVHEILVGLLWHDYLLSASLKTRDEKLVKCDGLAEDGSQLFRERSQHTLDACYPTTYVQELGKCIIGILSDISLKKSDLLNVFCTSFQKDCLEVIQEGDHLLKFHENLERIMRFFRLLDQHALQKGQTWPLHCLTRPLVIKSFPVIKSMDSPDVVRLLSVLVEIFGPITIFSYSGRTTDEGDAESKMKHFLQMFNDDFIPWCFHGHSDSSNSKLDLLIALVQDECFCEQWCSIITYATKLENFSVSESSDNFSRIELLAMLIEKVRERISTKKLGHLQKNGSLPGNWRHNLLDSIATFVACHSFSGVTHAKFLRAVLGGSIEDDQICFLSKEALMITFKGILKNLSLILTTSPFHWAKFSCSLFLSDGSMDFSHIQEPSSIIQFERARFAFEVLEGSIFCLKLLDEDCSLISSILAALFIIDWECSMTSHLGDDSSESCKYDADVKISVSASRDVVNNNSENQVSSKLALGRSMHAFCHKISTSFWRSLSSSIISRLGNILVQTIRCAVFETTDLSVNSVSALCSEWFLSMLEVICRDHTELQMLLDQMLSESRSWPLWVAPVFHDGTWAAKIQVKTVDMSTNELRHHQFVTFVDKIISSLGVGKVIAGVPDTPISTASPTSELVSCFSSCTRAWLAAELLCTWKWRAGSASDSFLPSLSQYAESEASSSVINVLSSVVKILLDGALVHGAYSQWISFNAWTVSDDDIESIQDPFLRALISLLLTLFVKDKIWGKSDADVFFEHVVGKLFVTTTVNRPCLRILPFVLSVIIQPLLESSELDEAKEDVSLVTARDDLVSKNILSWLKTALTFPSLGSGQTGQQDLEEWIQVVISCYPLSVVGSIGKFKVELLRDIGHPERHLLLSLFRKQRFCYDACTASNQMSSAASSNESSFTLMLVQMIQAKLTAVSVGYCWQEFDEDDWNFVLDKSHKWIESSVCLMEEIAEDIDDVVINCIATEDLELIKKKLEVAVQALDPLPMHISNTALIILCLLFQLDELHVADNVEMLQSIRSGKWAYIKDRIVGSVLRLFFATGVAEAIANACGGEASSIVASSRLAHSHFWGLVASFVINSPVRVKNAAVQSMELWGLSKGSVSSLYAILFSSRPIYSLQFAAYSILSSEPIRHLSLVKEGCLDGNAIANPESDLLRSAESSVEESFCLRDEISCLIQKPAAELFEMDLVAQDRVNVFLAWALLLSYLHSLPSSSTARERLIQYIQDSVSSTIIDCIFQHIPMKLGASNLKKKDVDLVVEASKAANAAKRAISTCSLFLYVESLWPVGTEQMASLAGAIYGMIIRLLPSYVRNWFTSLRDRSFSSAIEYFTKTWCSPPLLLDELSQVKETVTADENFSVSVNRTAYEIIATYKKEETGMDLVIRLPSCYPLRPVDVECTRSLGISEVKQRKWLLSLTAFVRNQNGAIAEAIRIWKSNFDKEFEGVEECPICYSILHTTNHSLPRLACKTCKHKFHSACLYKWFSTSHKSTCPLCQTPF
ncbi:E3 ubiquitin-protein ligase listerin isoform X1 [Phoenix dactylifera]|uniref:E3 ubiquitin-protein ligase listerin n=2 Tax=Phoenix dactylifera TaxID=42345 RepID=A0A8B7BP93_PHODC|nr:E3 ubiquitin-protein ligase listerin isoform X1 [Phoenix dactylifera]